MFEQAFGEGGTGFGRQRNLEAVLASVAAAADPRAVVEFAHVEETHAGQVAITPLQNRFGVRALQCEQHAVVAQAPGAVVARRMSVEMGDHVIEARRIADHVEGVAQPLDHQVVDQATGGVGQQRVDLAAVGQRDEVGGGERFQPGAGAGPADLDLPHVGHVEQAGVGARVEVFLQDARGVLDGHVPAGEGDHLCARGQVQRMKRCAAQGRGIRVLHRWILSCRAVGG